jgi:hypothetical protein
MVNKKNTYPKAAAHAGQGGNDWRSLFEKTIHSATHTESKSPRQIEAAQGTDARVLSVCVCVRVCFEPPPKKGQQHWLTSKGKASVYIHCTESCVFLEVREWVGAENFQLWPFQGKGMVREAVWDKMLLPKIFDKSGDVS